MKTISLYFALLCCLLISGKNIAANTTCPVAVAQMWSGGCHITLTTGTDCQTLDASSTGYYELAWSTNYTFCEGPVKVVIGGSPASTWLNGDNYTVFTIPSGNGTGYWMDRNVGGYVHLSPDVISQLKSDNGQYYWGVQSFYGSISGTGTFTIGASSNNPPTSASDIERVFNWLETKYPQYLQPSGATSQSISGYIIRYYNQTNVYIGTANGKLYIYAPYLVGDQVVDLGTMSSWLSQVQ